MKIIALAALALLGACQATAPSATTLILEARYLPSGVFACTLSNPTAYSWVLLESPSHEPSVVVDYWTGSKWQTHIRILDELEEAELVTGVHVNQIFLGPDEQLQFSTMSSYTLADELRISVFAAPIQLGPWRAVTWSTSNPTMQPDVGFASTADHPNRWVGP